MSEVMSDLFCILVLMTAGGLIGYWVGRAWEYVSPTGGKNGKEGLSLPRAFEDGYSKGYEAAGGTPDKLPSSDIFERYLSDKEKWIR